MKSRQITPLILLLSLLLAVLSGAAGESDADLNATADPTEGRTLDSFMLYRYGDVCYDSYEIVTLEGEYQVSQNGGDFQPLDAATVDALAAVIETYDLARWDGFEESRDDVLDGEGFSLEIAFRDGTSIHASGNNAFPPDYFNAVGELQEILDGIRFPRGLKMRGFSDFFATDPQEKDEWTVGEDIVFDDITEFYYTYDSSAYPPYYQRFRLYREDDRVLLYHETREGGGWPQTEADITASGTLELTEAQREHISACLAGGTVRAREDDLVDGDAGPWLYLYWAGDQGLYQEYAFPSWGARTDFEDFCAELRDGQ